MLKEHLDYVSDAVRLESYKAAVAQVVFPNAVVADLGCGSGILGLLCLRAGAGRVYAVDDSAMLEVARETFERAGYGERVTCIRGKSSQIELPEKVDIVVCDHVGYFGFDYGLIAFLDDARRRFLKPGGRLVPSRFSLELAPVSSKECRTLAHGWQNETIPPEFHWLDGYSVNTRHPIKLKADDLLGLSGVLGEIDLGAEHPEFLTWSVELNVACDGMLHGVAGWFECELAAEIRMTNSPLAVKPIHRPQAFLPIAEAVPVKTGDRIRATIMARPADQLIAWNVELPSAGKRFSHSTWQGLLLSRDHLIRANPDHVPRLTPEGQAQLTVLGYCDGKRSVSEIEAAVLRDHPQLFPTREEIARFIARVLGRDCR